MFEFSVRVSLFGSTSVFYRHTVDVVTLEVLARRFGLVLVETGESSAEICCIASKYRFGKRIGIGEQARCLVLDGCQLLPGDAFFRICANLDDPARASQSF